MTNTDILLEDLEDVLDDATSIPLSKKCAVDVDKIKTIIEDIRLNTPQETKQAKAIVDSRNSILEEAKKEAAEMRGIHESGCGIHEISGLNFPDRYANIIFVSFWVRNRRVCFGYSSHCTDSSVCNRFRSADHCRTHAAGQGQRSWRDRRYGNDL